MLKVTIDRSARIAQFSGDTFSAKEQIKGLGNARWMKVERVWQIESFDASDEELRAALSGVDLEVSVGGLKETPDNKPAVVPVVDEPNSEGASPSGVPDGLGVSQFLDCAKSALCTAFPGTVCVFGVLVKVTDSAGRRFMDLADANRPDVRVDCVIWQDAEVLCRGLENAGFKLEKDLPVMFQVSVGLNNRRGSISLSVESIVAEYTQAKLLALRDQTNERLKKEGLFSKNKNLALPFLPRRLGILTSASGTVINDFLASLDEAQFAFELFWLPVSVQGQVSKKGLVRSIAWLGQYAGLDAVLIFRGGGSPAELAVFNDYEVAKAVCCCPIPVVSAIGHQEDQSSVQDVSSRALGVPKNVGRFFADIVVDFRSRFHQAIERTLLSATRMLDSAEQLLSSTVRSIPAFGALQVARRLEQLRACTAPVTAVAGNAISARSFELRTLQHRIVDLASHLRATRMERAKSVLQRVMDLASSLILRHAEQLRRSADLRSHARRVIDDRQQAVTAYQALIKSVSPEAQLKRGFTMIHRKDGSYITSAGNLVKGEEVAIEFHDATRSAEIR